MKGKCFGEDNNSSIGSNEDTWRWWMSTMLSPNRQDFMKHNDETKKSSLDQGSVTWWGKPRWLKVSASTWAKLSLNLRKEQEPGSFPTQTQSKKHGLIACLEGKQMRTDHLSALQQRSQKCSRMSRSRSPDCTKDQKEAIWCFRSLRAGRFWVIVNIVFVSKGHYVRPELTELLLLLLLRSVALRLEHRRRGVAISVD